MANSRNHLKLDRLGPKRDRFADLTSIRDFREICRKKKFMGKFHGKSVDDKQRGFNSRMVRRQKEKCQACSIANQFQAVASKILPIKWVPGQNSIRRKRQILGMHAQ